MMASKVVEIEHQRYAELLAKEERLRLLETGVKKVCCYDTELVALRRVFGLEDVYTNE